MPGMKVELLGVKELEAKLNKLPIEVADIALDDVMDYMVNVLKTDQPTPKYVTRKEAYGQSFSSDKQRRWWFATHEMPYGGYNRTQEMSRGWHKVRTGITGHIVNYMKGVAYVVGDKSQANLNRLVGWKTIGQQISDRAVKIGQIIDGSAKKAIRKLGL